jgi:hypothetical protein
MKSEKRSIALALNWDGSRCSSSALPPKARAFLAGKTTAGSTPQSVARLLADDQVREIRICWVPRLKGGRDVLSEPFLTKDGLRVGFKSVKIIQFGDILSVVYRRLAA